MAEKSVLKLEYALIDYIEFYVVQDGVTTSFVGGDEINFNKRPIENPFFVYPVNM